MEAGAGAVCGVRCTGEGGEELLEFAAIATVGDVMRLQDENRIIVKYGLSRMEHTSSIGLRKSWLPRTIWIYPRLRHTISVL